MTHKQILLTLQSLISITKEQSEEIGRLKTRVSIIEDESLPKINRRFEDEDTYKTEQQNK